MNPYLATAIAMCVIVLLSLAGTAYLAAALNRRAKSDLQARLEPLAAAIDGAADVEEARVDGRFRGQIAIGRVTNAAGGFGRLFHVELVDSAGGMPWEWSSLPDKKGPGLTRTFEGDSEVVWFEGNYQAYIEDLKKRKGADADQPHRIKYKALVRS